MLIKDRPLHNYFQKALGHWPLLAVWAALLGIFATALFSNGTLGMVDYSRHYYPFKAYAVACIKAGLLPLWNPLVYCGYPQVGEIQVNFLYPGNLLLLFGDFTRRLEQYTFLHYLLAAGGAYFLGLVLGLRRESAAVLAALYAMNAHLLTIHQIMPALCSLSYLPLVVACYYRFFQRGGTVYLLGGMLALTLQIYAGYSITVYQTILALLILLVPPALVSRQGRRRILWLVASGAGAGALSAGVLLPFGELLNFTDRAAGGVMRPTPIPRPVPWEAFKALFSPVAFGTPLDYHGPIKVICFGAYYGGAALLFLVVFAALGFRRTTGRRFAALGLAALVLMLGEGVPWLGGVLTALLPGLAQIEKLGSFYCLLLLSLAVLAAGGYQRLVSWQLFDARIASALAASALAGSVLVWWACRAAYDQVAFFTALLAVLVLLRWKRLLNKSFPTLVLSVVLMDLILAANFHLPLANENAYRRCGAARPLPDFHGRYHPTQELLRRTARLRARNYTQLLEQEATLRLLDWNLLTGEYSSWGYSSFDPLINIALYHRLEIGECRLAAVTEYLGKLSRRRFRHSCEPPMMVEHFERGLFRRDDGLLLRRDRPGRMRLSAAGGREVVVKESYHPGWRLYDAAGAPAGEIALISGGMMNFDVRGGGEYILRFEPFSYKLGVFITLLALSFLPAAGVSLLRVWGA